MECSQFEIVTTATSSPLICPDIWDMEENMFTADFASVERNKNICSVINDQI